MVLLPVCIPDRLANEPSKILIIHLLSNHSPHLLSLYSIQSLYAPTEMVPVTGEVLSTLVLPTGWTYRHHSSVSYEMVTVSA